MSKPNPEDHKSRQIFALAPQRESRQQTSLIGAWFLHRKEQIQCWHVKPKSLTPDKSSFAHYVLCPLRTSTICTCQSLANGVLRRKRVQIPTASQRMSQHCRADAVDKGCCKPDPGLLQPSDAVGCSCTDCLGPTLPLYFCFQWRGS